jgi:hypothetical protein
MQSLTLTRAFVRFGAAVPRGLQPRWVLAGDGALVLCCSPTGFSRPQRDVLHYQDTLSSQAGATRQQAQLAQKMHHALEASLPVRLIIVTPGAGDRPAMVGVRPDLVGKVTGFDGDAFGVDFTRIAIPQPKPNPKAKSRRKR